ncbi:hypothetical protein, partial [Streptomyces sp. 1222.5]|uniref:hypothetical protein n=1 Tax=Streptomyces sp. 1222.5 TaxID=1881026 RepID=UPI003D720C81
GGSPLASWCVAAAKECLSDWARSGCGRRDQILNLAVDQLRAGHFGLVGRSDAGDCFQRVWVGEGAL